MDSDSFGSAISVERDRLVRLCARLTGSVDNAEDLAQETLLEAWKNQYKLEDVSGITPWLAAIARNVCLRWMRQHGRRSRQIDLRGTDLEDIAGLINLEDEFERRERAELLHQALKLLPGDTRNLLVARLFHHSSVAGIASRLGMSEDAVSMRLARGKQRLRKTMMTQFYDDCVAHELVRENDAWQETRIWCLDCGERQLLLRRASPPGTISFRCPACEADPAVSRSDYRLTNPFFVDMLSNLVQPKAIHRRAAAWGHEYFRSAIDDGMAPCTSCGLPVVLRRNHDTSSPFGRLVIHCTVCDEVCTASFRGLVSTLPEVLAFCQAEGRVRTLPEYVVEHDGKAAIISRFESVGRQVTLDVVSSLDSYRVVHVCHN